ncbi:TPA: hypothetical protein DCE37_15030 [Candidatus Latescibacteria bacterium]|nr:hypothetical protein [Candidatus Latescibacterota bacterium]
MKLTQQQLDFFDTFGYLSFPGLVSDVIDEIIDAFEEIWASQGGGHHGRPHDEKRRSCIVPFIDQHPQLCALLDDERIHGILAGLLGDDFNYSGSDGNYYAGNTQWHSDGWGKDIRFVKIAFYLDEITKDTGCLRVIPGSHRLEDRFANRVQDAIKQSTDEWGLQGEEIPAQALETKPGDIVCFNHNLKHAAFGGGSRRRMFTINCSQRFPNDRLDDLRTYIAGHARFWNEHLYGKTMLETASPQRMVHLEQGRDNCDHLPKLVRKAMSDMEEPSRG